MGKLFDIEEGRRLRDVGIARADNAAHTYWKDCAFCAVIAVASKRDEFTTDHVHKEMYINYQDAWTHELRALGAIMREAAKNGICRLTDRRWKSERPVAHRNPKAVWLSLIRPKGSHTPTSI